MLDKLPDKGAKYRSTLYQYCEELDRRSNVRIQKGVTECPRATHCESSGEVGSNSTPKGSNSQEMSESKTGAAFSEELSIMSKHLRENGLSLQEERQPLQKRPKVTRKDKCGFSTFKFADTVNISSLQARKNLSRRLSKRRRAAKRGWKDREFEEVQHVVLLDDEDAQPMNSTQGGDAFDNREYKIYYPSRGDPECVELFCSDVNCLEPESYLSSPIMNFYIQYLQRSPSLMAKRKGDCYIFNTYFYSKLEEAITCKNDRSGSFLKLRRWWKGVDIFQKAYIFLPIHGDMHWSLVIICIPAKEDESGLIILHLDSLGLHASSHIFSIVGSYLREEWNYINENAPPSDPPISERIWKHLPRRIEKEKIMVPQQKNEYDCGLFVLYFMERFIKDAPERLRKKDLSIFGRKWFKPEDASGLRDKVREVVNKEFETNMLKLKDGMQEWRASTSASENSNSS
ncbi:uncharacterized protein A4U43_C05F11470 [Asparagus officinalis]|uniref:Ubiquitin-like protease family profile domain-containing protein n=1 Tax=Asparagus officinalis TaxID=4686 RepID=A0A5P1EQZ1_ASPOF|nr:ubiquitin-like-specific protease 1D [Asparagus officinalis]ONK68435.1 uncharacterized protein A4U43_C05F11470 [Asparagus officinalis]